MMELLMEHQDVEEVVVALEAEELRFLAPALVEIDVPEA